jgi:hypothetical protein
MKVSRFPKWLAVLSPAIIPFAGLPLVGIGSASLTVSRVYFLILLVAYFINVAFSRRVVSPGRRSGAFILVLTVYGLLLTVSIFWSDDQVRAVSYVVYYFWYLISIGVILALRFDEKDLEKFYNIWVLTAGFVALMCFIEITFEVRFPGSRYLYDRGNNYRFPPTATFYNENNLAVYLSMSSIFAIARSQSVGTLARWFILLILVWVFYVILLTASKGGFVIFLAGILLFVAISNKLSAGAVLKISGSIVVALMIASSAGFIDDVILQFNQVALIAEEGDGRISLLNNAFVAMQENYSFGVGAGGIENYMHQFSNVRVENVHNWIGEVAANTGILGGAIWMGLVFSMFYWSFGLRKHEDKYGVSAVVVVILFPLWQSIVSSMIQFTAFWLFIAAFLIRVDLRRGSVRD